MEEEQLKALQAELGRVQRRLEEKARRYDELSKELTAQRATASSSDETVWATVDGNGRLQDLEIFAEAMDRAHPESMGDKVVEAVRDARAQASAESLVRVQAVLPEGDFIT